MKKTLTYAAPDCFESETGCITMLCQSSGIKDLTEDSTTLGGMFDNE